MATDLAPLPQGVVGPDLVLQVNDRLRRIALAIGTGSGQPGPAGPPGPPGQGGAIVVPGGDTQVLYNHSGTMAASPNFTFKAANNLLHVQGGAGTGMQAYTFSSFAAAGDFAFTNAGKTFGITGAGDAGFQTVAIGLHDTPTTGVGGGSNVGNALLSATIDGLYLSLNGGTPVLFGGVPGGANTEVQFNNNGAFGGTPDFTWDANLLSITGRVKPDGLALNYLANALAGPPNTAMISARNDGIVFLSLNGGIAQPFGVPAPPDQSVQFNHGGLFGSSPYFKFDYAGNGALTVGDPNAGTGVISAGRFEAKATGDNETFFSGDFLVHGAGDVRALSLNTTTGGVATNNLALNFQPNALTGAASTAMLSATVAGLYLSLNGGIPVPFGGLTPPGGANTEVQFNNNGAFGGTPDFTFNADVLTVNGSVQPTSLALTFVPVQLAGPPNTALLSATSAGVFLSMDGGVAALFGTPSPPLKSVQFNNNGVFGGTADLEWGSNLLSVTGSVKPDGLALNYLANALAGPPNTATLSARNDGVVFLSLNGGIAQPFGVPAPPDKSVQFNHGGFFGSSPYFTFDYAGNGALTVGDPNAGTGVVTAGRFEGKATGGNQTFVSGDFLVHGAGDVRALSLTTTTGGVSTNNLALNFQPGALTGPASTALLSATTAGLYLSLNGGVPVLLGGGGTPGGSNTQFQFNNNGAFGGTAGMYWDAANQRVGIGVSAPATTLDVNLPSLSAQAHMLRWGISGGATLGYLTEDPNGYFSGALQLNQSGVLNTFISANGSSYFMGGNVGIGTTTPNAKLQVAAPSGIPIAAAFTGNVNNALVRVDDITSQASLRLAVAYAAGAYLSGSALGDALIYSGTGQGVGIGTSGIVRLYVSSAGLVGIGTTAPGFPLDIIFATNTEFRLRSATTGQPQVSIAAIAGNGPSVRFFLDDVPTKAVSIGLSHAGAAPTPGDFTIDTWNGSTYTERVRVLNTGNVGIGVSNPGQPLHVYASGADTHVLVDVLNQATYMPMLTLRQQNVAIWNIALDTTDAQKLKFAYGGGWNNVSAGTKMTITGAGNVGIGTTAPLNVLHVHVGADQNVGIRSNSRASIGTFNDAGTAGVPLGFDASRFDFSGGNVGIGTTAPASKLTIIAPNPTTAQGANQLAIGESSDNPGYRLQLGYYPTSVYNGVVQAMAGGAGATLLINPIGGNVGIGTTAPATVLDVNLPSLSAQAHMLRWGISGGNALGYLTEDPNGYFSGALQLNQNGALNTFISANGSSYFMGGNVGIGTTTPNAKLQVAAPSGIPIAAAFTGNVNNALVRVDDITSQASLRLAVAYAAGAYLSGSALGDALIYSGTGQGVGIGTGGTVRLYVSSVGNVTAPNFSATAASGITFSSPGFSVQSTGQINVLSVLAFGSYMYSVSGTTHTGAGSGDALMCNGQPVTASGFPLHIWGGIVTT